MKNIEKELVPLYLEVLRLSEVTEVLNETSVTCSPKFIVQEKNLSKILTYFYMKFEHINMNRIIETTTLEPGKSLEKNIDEIK